MKYIKLLFLIVIVAVMALCKQLSIQEVSNKSASLPNEYTEKHRPQFHFSPEANWMNDPNGMVYYKGEYHLFYQYYPDSTVWGPMHWGHAVSRDLTHWEHLPIALFPDKHGLIFSGSAVIDWNNTSGFGQNGEPPMVAIYSYHSMEIQKTGADDFETQGIAYSNDNGRTWTKYENNPVIKNPGIRDFRDPKVIWHEETDKWIMAVAAHDHLKFYGSADLKEWTMLSEFGKDIGSHDGVWECPDLFPMTADNGKEYWVIIENMNPGNPNGGSGTQYFIGQFDGQHFAVDPDFMKILEDQGSVWLDAGRDNYAGVTWSDIPKSDGRRVFLGWMSNWSYAQKVPTEKWRSAMTVPWELNMKIINNIPRLIGVPVEELESLRLNKIQTGNKSFSIPNGLAEVNTRFSALDDFSFVLSNESNEQISFQFNATKNQFSFDKTKVGGVHFSDDFAGIHAVKRIGNHDQITFKALIDHSSIEIFLDDGSNIFTEIFFPSTLYSNIEMRGKFDDVEAFELARIWD